MSTSMLARRYQRGTLRVVAQHAKFIQYLDTAVLVTSVALLQYWIIGPILWGHSGPFVMRCHCCCRRRCGHRCAGGV